MSIKGIHGLRRYSGDVDASGIQRPGLTNVSKNVFGKKYRQTVGPSPTSTIVPTGLGTSQKMRPSRHSSERYPNLGSWLAKPLGGSGVQRPHWDHRHHIIEHPTSDSPEAEFTETYPASVSPRPAPTGFSSIFRGMKQKNYNAMSETCHPRQVAPSDVPEFHPSISKHRPTMDIFFRTRAFLSARKVMAERYQALVPPSKKEEEKKEECKEVEFKYVSSKSPTEKAIADMAIHNLRRSCRETKAEMAYLQYEMAKAEKSETITGSDEEATLQEQERKEDRTLKSSAFPKNIRKKKTDAKSTGISKGQGLSSPKKNDSRALEKQIAEKSSATQAEQVSEHQSTRVYPQAVEQVLTGVDRPHTPEQQKSADVETSKGATKTVDELVNELLSEGCLIPFREDEKNVLYGFFELHDDDGSNSLSLEELVCVTEDIGRSPPEGSEDARQFERLMHKADQDNSGSLNFEEFIAFLAEYYQSVYARLFVENDQDRSGTITKFEIKGLMIKLRDRGFKVRCEDIVDMFQSMDRNRDEVLDWEEFCDFMCEFRKLEYELLKVSAGFSEIEIDYLHHIYKKADTDGNGVLNIKEVLAFLKQRMQGSQIEKDGMIDKIAHLFSKLDKDKSMTLDFLEFIRLIRVWSNTMVKGKQDILRLFKDDLQHISVKTDEDPAQVRTFGRRNTAEAARVAECRAIAAQHDLEDGIIAAHQNLEVQHVRILREFFTYSEDGSGAIDSEELSTILKNFFFAPITEQQTKAFSETLELEDFYGSFEFPLLVQFLQLYHKACVEEALLDVSTVWNDLAVWRVSCGFSPTQLKMIRKAFDASRTGAFMKVSDGSVFKALEALNLAPEPEKRDPLIQAFLRLDRQGKGIILFQDFLLPVRQLENEKLAARTAQEQQMAEFTGLKDDVVQLLREHFNDCGPNFSGKVESGKIQKCISTLGTITTADQRKQLKKVIDDVTRDDMSGVTFAQFLDVVHRLESQGISSRRMSGVLLAPVEAESPSAVGFS